MPKLRGERGRLILIWFVFNYISYVFIFLLTYLSGSFISSFKKFNSFFLLCFESLRLFSFFLFWISSVHVFFHVDSEPL
jgi:hypothetical protein